MKGICIILLVVSALVSCTNLNNSENEKELKSSVDKDIKERKEINGESLTVTTFSSREDGGTQNALQREPPLSPVNGGKSTDGKSLRIGDILFSTTDGKGSPFIRFFTGGGPVSHVAIVSQKLSDNLIYIIEAMPSDGVRKIELNDYLKVNALSVAFRYPSLSEDVAKNNIVAYLNSRIGAPYDKGQALLADATFFNYYNKKVIVDYGQERSQGTYCSRLVLEAYQSANIQLTDYSGQWSPNQLVNLSLFGVLEYVGHLKY